MVEIANYRLGSTTAERPLSASAIDFVFTVFTVFTQGVRVGSRPPKLPAAVKPPLRITDASLASRAYSTRVSANGMSFHLSIRTGASPSRRDVDALKAIVASIHFPPLRIGHFTPNNLYVLGQASSYPVGAVMEVPSGPLPYYPKLRSGRFYLVHGADGFWAITWRNRHGYSSCGPRYDAKRQRLSCPNGAVWDLEGQVIRNPNPSRYADDPLGRTQAVVADGDVLVTLPAR